MKRKFEPVPGAGSIQIRPSYHSMAFLQNASSPRTVAGMFSPVQALKRLEYAIPECPVQSREPLSSDGEYPVWIHTSG